LLLAVAFRHRTVTVEIVALENLVEVDLLLADILVAAAAVQGPTALT
jgi:hypothetical protein